MKNGISDTSRSAHTAHLDHGQHDTSSSNDLSVNGDLLWPADECWLYKPKVIVNSGIPVRTWLRDIFDSPSSIFWSSRRNLLVRLEAILAAGGQVAAYRFGGSVPTLNLLSTPQTSARLGQKLSSDLPYVSSYGEELGKSTINMPSFGSSDSLSTMIRKADGINAYKPYFGRSEQPIYSLPPQFSCSQRLSAAPSISSSHLSQSVGGPFSRKWSGSTGKMGSCDALESLQTNVQEIARIQEDNLKADVAALVAAAAGKYGSQHSLGSQGQRTPDGSSFRLASAPGSPSSSNPCLDILQTTDNAFTGTVSRSTFARSSLEGIPYYSTTGNFSEESVCRVPTSISANAHAIGTLNHRSSNPHIKSSFPILPQKPVVPTDATLHSPSTQNVSSQPGIAIPVEAKTHFGFRPLRKTSVPQFLSKPPALPTGTRRTLAMATQQSID